jgi:hypothetical protein
VRERGHRMMCATCTLTLRCQCKPSAASAHVSPSPSPSNSEDRPSPLSLAAASNPFFLNQVRECGHRMCAMCTLALCCHCKPSAASPHAPPPACPFCRTEIKQLEALTPVHEKPEALTPVHEKPLTAAKGKSKVHNASWGRW